MFRFLDNFLSKEIFLLIIVHHFFIIINAIFHNIIFLFVFINNKSISHNKTGNERNTIDTKTIKRTSVTPAAPVENGEPELPF